MKINLKLSEDVFVPKFFPFLTDYSHRWEFYMGGAGSGKSVFIQQKLIYRALTEPGIRILICRKTAASIRESVFADMKIRLDQWKLTPYVKINQSNMTILFPNNSQMIFIGLDTETRLLSLADISCIFIEEAYEVEQTFVEQLNLRMRGQQPNQQILMAWNPISQSSWLYEFTVTNPPESSIFIHSTFEDNPFLSEEYKSTIRELQTRNPVKWKVYGLGEWGSDPEGLVLRNWMVEEFNPQELAKTLEYRVGSDLGYIDPTTIVKTLYDKQNNTIYVFDCYYETGKQLEEVAKAMESMELKHVRIYMDAAEPRSIAFFRQKGFNTVPCLKGPGSVDARIQFLQNNKIIVLPKCKDLIAELENFCYLKDKKTGKYTEETDHQFSHAIDGLGYAYSDIYTNNKLRSYDKSLLGL